MVGRDVSICTMNKFWLYHRENRLCLLKYIRFVGLECSLTTKECLSNVFVLALTMSNATIEAMRAKVTKLAMIPMKMAFHLGVGL